MKTLVVHNYDGELIFTQTNVLGEYSCFVEDIEDTKEIIGVDISTNKCILTDRQSTTEEKEQLQVELEAKNAELEETKSELLETQATLVDSTYNNLLN